MLIGGLQKLSLVDYPGKTCVSIFTIGCNMRCGFCHNPELVLPEMFATGLDNQQILNFLAKRVGLVQAVTISGGEPTLHQDLPVFIQKVKRLGYLVKLDTNGTQPKMIEKLLDLGLLDFIAMDIKSSLDKYETITNRPINSADIKRSISLIKNSGLDYEFRTTIVQSLHQVADFEAIGQLIASGGKAKRYALQHFQPAKTLDPKYRQDSTLSPVDFIKIETIMQNYAREVIVH